MSNEWTGSRVLVMALSICLVPAMLVAAPKPPDGAVGVSLDPVLQWPADPDAGIYILYVGTNPEDVAAATLATQPDSGVQVIYPIVENEYALQALDPHQTYYWRVDALVGQPDYTHVGVVWSFSTTASWIVDDFESYTNNMDAGEAIFQTWIDGWGDPFNGAWVGYMDAPFAELDIVFEGDQSMPFWYDNIDGFAWAQLSWHAYLEWLIELGYGDGAELVSETTRTFDEPIDWAAEGVRYLVLYVRGDVANTGGQLYARINDQMVNHPDEGVLTLPLWNQWVIDLQEIEADQTVESLSLGVAGQDYGIVYVDQIGLFSAPPDEAEPQDPGDEHLALWYSMDAHLQNLAGETMDGLASGEPVYAPGVIGSALLFDGSDDYVTVPIGRVIRDALDMTITTWVDFSNQGGGWQRIFDFGSGTSINMFLTPRTGTDGPMRFAIRTASVGEQQLTAPTTLPSGWHHVAVVIRGTTGTMALYLDSQKVAEAGTSLTPADMGTTTNNWLGRSQYSADAYFQGALDEFRIYTTALTELEIQYLAGGQQ